MWTLASRIILEANGDCGTDFASSPTNRGLFSTHRAVSILFQRVTQPFQGYNWHVLKFIQTTLAHLISDSKRTPRCELWQCEAEINFSLRFAVS